MTHRYLPPVPVSLSRVGTWLALLLIAVNPLRLSAEATPAPAAQPDFMQWFKDARLGIFIHWGIYSEGKGSESWAFHNGEIPHDEYYAQAATFTASAYDPEKWADLFKAAGARYVVLTSKLHAKDGSPAGRDLIGPYCSALRSHGLKVGLYFSHLDWAHPDYASILPPGAKTNPDKPDYKNKYGFPQNGENPEAWKRFLAFHRGQLREISERFHPDLLWFDGDWERSEDQWGFPELRAQLKAANPNVILNSRMGSCGDYETPEQYLPLVRPKGIWEFCMTINDSWGYQKKDHNHKSVRQVVRMLAECASMGGNLLLDVGPRSDGTLQPEQVAVLEGLGKWTSRNSEAIFVSEARLPPGYFLGTSTLSKSKDTLYLFYYDRPIDSIALKGIKNKIKRISVLGGPELTFKVIGGADWLDMPGIAWINLPDCAVDANATVIKVELEGTLRIAEAPKASTP